MALDPRPLSERFDLTYVQRRRWPYGTNRWVSLLLVFAVGGYVAYMTLRGDHRIYNSGSLIHAHAMFGADCTRCHESDPNANGFWLPVRDEACLQCHVAPAHPDPHGGMFAGSPASVSDRLGTVIMASNCASCHVEHRGAEHSLTALPDDYCIACHRDLDAYTRAAAINAGKGATP